MRENRFEISRISPVPGGEYDLPGQGESYDSCGRVKFKIVCENCSDESLAKHHCDRKECPKCYTTWAVRRARVASNKLESGHKQMGGRYRPRHIMVSPPANMWDMSYNEVLKAAFEIVHRYAVGSYGGTYVGHPWSFVDGTGKPLQWKHCDLNSEAVEPISEGFAVYRPHVHFIMFGWLAPSEEVERETGFVIKMIDKLPNRVDVFSCVFYQLTHCGIHESRHAIRWFGNMSYNNFVKVSESTETIYPLCVLCDGELWAYTVAGDLLQRHCLEITRFHYRFKPRQKTIFPQKRKVRLGSIGDPRHKGRSTGSRSMARSYQAFRLLEGKITYIPVS